MDDRAQRLRRLFDGTERDLLAYALRRVGDKSVIDEAQSALQTARRWPILTEMARSGDYPKLLWQDIARVSRYGRLGDWSGGTPCGA